MQRDVLKPVVTSQLILLKLPLSEYLDIHFKQDIIQYSFSTVDCIFCLFVILILQLPNQTTSKLFLKEQFYIVISLLCISLSSLLCSCFQCWGGPNRHLHCDWCHDWDDVCRAKDRCLRFCVPDTRPALPACSNRRQYCIWKKHHDISWQLTYLELTPLYCEHYWTLL